MTLFLFFFFYISAIFFVPIKTYTISSLIDILFALIERTALSASCLFSNSKFPTR